MKLNHLLVMLCLCGFAMPALPTAEVETASASASAKLTPQWTAAQFTGVPAIEQEIVRLTNAARAQNRLPLLSDTAPLRVAALQHSWEMGALKYFSHESPKAEWKKPWQRAYYAGFWESQVAENILIFNNPPPNTPAGYAAAIMNSWMNSAGHRKNILDPTRTLIGVGVCWTGKILYATQNFASTVMYLEGATLTKAGGNQVTVKLSGSAARGNIDVWVDNKYQQTIRPTSGNFTATVTQTARSGTHTLMLAVNRTIAWTAKLDTTPATPRITVTPVAGSKLLVRPSTTVTPATGYNLRAIVLVGNTQYVRVQRDGKDVTRLTPGTTGRITLNLSLSVKNGITTIGFATPAKFDNLLFIDTSRPISSAFRGRPE